MLRKEEEQEAGQTDAELDGQWESQEMELSSSARKITPEGTAREGDGREELWEEEKMRNG